MSRTSNRLVLVSRFFPPSRAVGGRRVAQIARSFAARGWEVAVVAPREAAAGAAAHAGVQRAMPNVRIIFTPARRNPLPLAAARPLGGSGEGPRSRADGPVRASLKLLRDLLVFPDESNLWIPTGYRAAARLVRSQGRTVVLTSAPPASAHLIGWLLKRRYGRRVWWVADFRDPYVYPDWESSARLVDALHRRAFARIVRRADWLTGTTGGIVRTFESADSSASRRSMWVPNGVPTHLFADVAPKGLAAGKTVLIHLGDLDYDHRNPRPLLRALGRLITQGALEPSAIELHFFGQSGRWGGQTLAQMARSAGCDACVVEHGAVPHDEALALMRGCDALLLLAEGQPLSIPAKTYEYLASGRPMLAFTEPGGATHDLLGGVPGVTIVTAADEPAIEAAVLQLVRARSGGGRLPDRPAGPSSQFAMEEHLERLADVADQRASAAGPPAPSPEVAVPSAAGGSKP